jgi:hypothetical protein
MAASGTQNAARFYDDLAGDYELVYGGEWERAVDEQAGALDRLIRQPDRLGTDAAGAIEH